MWRVLVLIFIVVSATPCTAEIGSLTLEDYRKAKGAYVDYLTGVKEGIVSSLAMLPENDRMPICLPGNLALTVEQADDILMRYAEVHKLKGGSLVSLLLFGGLKETFPCPLKR